MNPIVARDLVSPRSSGNFLHMHGLSEDHSDEPYSSKRLSFSLILFTLRISSHMELFRGKYFDLHTVYLCTGYQKICMNPVVERDNSVQWEGVIMEVCFKIKRFSGSSYLYFDACTDKKFLYEPCNSEGLSLSSIFDLLE